MSKLLTDLTRESVEALWQREDFEEPLRRLLQEACDPAAPEPRLVEIFEGIAHHPGFDRIKAAVLRNPSFPMARLVEAVSFSTWYLRLALRNPVLPMALLSGHLTAEHFADLVLEDLVQELRLCPCKQLLPHLERWLATVAIPRASGEFGCESWMWNLRTLRKRALRESKRSTFPQASSFRLLLSYALDKHPESTAALFSLRAATRSCFQGTEEVDLNVVETLAMVETLLGHPRARVFTAEELATLPLPKAYRVLRTTREAP